MVSSPLHPPQINVLGSATEANSLLEVGGRCHEFERSQTLGWKSMWLVGLVWWFFGWMCFFSKRWRRRRYFENFTHFGLNLNCLDFVTKLIHHNPSTVFFLIHFVLQWFLGQGKTCGFVVGGKTWSASSASTEEVDWITCCKQCFHP